MCDKVECNYVAKAQNWDQRVKGEIESARVSSTRLYFRKIMKVIESVSNMSYHFSSNDGLFVLLS